MNGFVYFLPNVQSRPATLPPQLSHVTIGPHARGTSGPTQQPGMFFMRPGCDESLCRYLPDEQQWRKVPLCEAWCGYYAENRPGPDDFVRSETIDGHQVILGDGNHWLMPKARSYAENDDGDLYYVETLPRSMDVDDLGKWVPGDIVATHAHLWPIACWWFDFLADKEVGDHEVEDENETAYQIITTNYQIGRAEVAALGLLTMKSIGDIFNALIDIPGFQEIQKKKRAVGTNSIGGNGDLIETIDLPSVI